MPQSQSENQPAQSLSNKVIMVTGSSSGIGRAIAMELAARGAKVLIHGRQSSAGLSKTLSEIESGGHNAIPVYCDFTRTESLDEFVETAWGIHDGIDAWINNAGGDVLTGDWPSRPLIEKLDFLWTVDVVSTLLLSRAVGKKMVERFQKRPAKESRPGLFSIINVGWDQAEHGMAGDSGELFATTKGAIMSLSRSLAKSLAPAVRVNCLAPGWIQTKWGDNANEYWSQRACHESLMNRWGEPHDVAAAAAFLCSDDASFIAGQVIPVNGGFRNN